MKRFIVGVAIVAAFLMTDAAGAVAPAFASCTLGSHCYIYGELNIANDGADLSIVPQCQYVPLNGADFTNDEMWVAPYAGAGYWIEAGLKNGYGVGGGGVDANNYFFWASWGSAGYGEWDDTGAHWSDGTAYSDVINSLGTSSDQWYVQVGPFGNSDVTNQQMYAPAGTVEAGLELRENSSDGGYADGVAQGLAYVGQAGHYTSG
jgi:hypothetical protein